MPVKIIKLKLIKNAKIFVSMKLWTMVYFQLRVFLFYVSYWDSPRIKIIYITIGFVILVRVLDVIEKVWACFIDRKKLFYRVNWETFMRIILDIRIKWRDRSVMKDMEQNVKVRVNGGETESTFIRFSLSLTLRNICGEWLINEGLEGLHLKVGGSSMA